MIRINYIHTIDFDFNDVEVINCNTAADFEKKIKENEVILIKLDGITYGINPSYIMYFN